MKKLSISIFAVVAIVFAAASAFTTKATPVWKGQTANGTFVTLTDISGSSTPSQAYLNQHCPPSSQVICIQKFVDDEPQSGAGDIFLNGLYR